jgi:hypothetical protein
VPDDFLPDRDERTWRVDSPPTGVTPDSWWRGRGDAFRAEVALARAASRPRANAIRELWQARAGGGTPVFLVVTYPNGGVVQAATCGPVGEQPPIRWDLELEQVARLATAVLDEPEGHSAVRLLLGRRLRPRASAPRERLWLLREVEARFLRDLTEETVDNANRHERLVSQTATQVVAEKYIESYDQNAEALGRQATCLLGGEEGLL